MTLYDMLKRLKEHHARTDYERSRTPWAIGLGMVRGRLPAHCRCDDIEKFETLIRGMFAGDFADSELADAHFERHERTSGYRNAFREVSSDEIRCRSGEEYDEKFADLIKDEMAADSKNGSAYRILAAIYREFPDFVDSAFPLGYGK